MQFREFIEQDSLPLLLGSFALQVKSYVLNSLNVSYNELAIRFPTNFENYFGAEDQQPFMRLAAHAVTDGPVVTEAPNDEHPLGKGGLAFNAIKDSPWAKSLKGREPYQFQKSLKTNLRLIAKEMGMVFELQLFIAVVNAQKMQVRGNHSLTKAYSEVSEYYEQINNKVGGTLSKHIGGFIEHHAADLANKVYDRAVRLLKCKVDYAIFMGGNILGTAPTGHRVTADIMLGCSALKSGRNEIGFTTKFTSEPQVRIADLWFKQAYLYLGGRAPAKFDAQLKEIGADERKGWILDVLEKLAAEAVKKPQQINWLFNKLLLGTEDSDGPGSAERIADVYPAFRNYVRNTGEGDFSPVLKSDFNVTDRQGMKLTVRNDSTISSRRTGAAVLINVKTPGGSPSGTFLKFDVDMDRVIVKMNNLGGK